MLSRVCSASKTKHQARHWKHEVGAQLLTGVDEAFMVFFRWW